MARSVFKSFVGGVRGMLSLQLFLTISAAGVAGYTMLVTTDAMRERDTLLERVTSLEAEIERITGAPPAEDLRPLDIMPEVPLEPVEEPPPVENETPQQPVPETPAPTPNDPTGRDPIEPRPNPQPDPVPPPPRAETPTLDLGQVLRDDRTQAPPLRTMVLHVRSQNDHAAAARIVRELSGSNIEISIDVMPARDPRNSGFAYFDSRQARAATAMARRVQTIAQQNQFTAWATTLRGVSLPASGEYTPDRLDIVLPPLTTAPTPPTRIPETRLRVEDRVLAAPPPPPPPQIR
jgi:hypothetical protein